MRPLTTPRSASKISILSLVLVNLIPLGGVLFGGWEVKQIILLYGLESLLIGVVHIIKLLFHKGDVNSSFFANIPLTLFFIVHYFGFTLIQLVFILFTVTKESKGQSKEFNSESLQSFYISLLLIFMSHIVSLIVHYFGENEYKKGSRIGLMFQPYKRVFLQQFLIILAGVFFVDSKSPLYVLILFVVLKTFFDLISHIWLHLSTAKK